MAMLTDIAADSMSAAGRSSEKLNLHTLQSKMKSDPEGYSSELTLVYNQFKSSLELFHQQAALNFTSLSGIATDSAVAKDLGDRAMFLAHVTPFYPKELAQFPGELVKFLHSSARNLPSGLRVHVTQAVILLINRKVVFFCWSGVYWDWYEWARKFAFCTILGILLSSLYFWWTLIVLYVGLHGCIVSVYLFRFILCMLC